MALPRRLVGYLGAGARAVASAAAAAGASVVAIARDLRARFSNLGIAESRQLARYIQSSEPPPPPEPPSRVPAPIGDSVVRCNPQLVTNYRYVVTATTDEMAGAGESPYRTPIDSPEILSEQEVRDRVIERVSDEEGSFTRGLYIPAGDISSDFRVDVLAIEYREC